MKFLKDKQAPMHKKEILFMATKMYRSDAERIPNSDLRTRIQKKYLLVRNTAFEVDVKN
jgi:hypothetical protein